MERIQRFLEERKSKDLLRRLQPAARREAGKIYLKNQEYLDFSSNDYLGLSCHPALQAAAAQATRQLGTGAAASRLLSGDLEIHHQLEEEIARFKGKESGLVFNSGYQANLGIISALYNRRDAVFCDRLNHASIIDGVRLAGANLFRFRHNDPQHLAWLLKKQRDNYQQTLIVTETIFSMDGDAPPLEELIKLKLRYRCQIMVDEAHATGIFGENGSGLVEARLLSDEVDLIMGTFSKALGSFGAYLACSRQITDYLVNCSRSFIYSTALPPGVIAANLEALELIKQEPGRRQGLLKRADYLRDKLREKGYQVKGLSQIVPLIIGDSQKAVELSRRLAARGYWALPIRPPTVPAQEARLRLSLTYHHSKSVLDKLIKAIDEVRRL